MFTCLLPCASFGRLCMELDVISLEHASHMFLVVCGCSSTVWRLWMRLRRSTAIIDLKALRAATRMPRERPWRPKTYQTASVVAMFSLEVSPRRGEMIIFKTNANSSWVDARIFFASNDFKSKMKKVAGRSLKNWRFKGFKKLLKSSKMGFIFIWFFTGWSPPLVRPPRRFARSKGDLLIPLGWSPSCPWRN